MLSICINIFMFSTYSVYIQCKRTQNTKEQTQKKNKQKANTIKRASHITCAKLRYF